MWLKVTKTNNDPIVVASFYIHAVSDFYVCPQKIRSDRNFGNYFFFLLPRFFLFFFLSHFFDLHSLDLLLASAVAYLFCFAVTPISFVLLSWSCASSTFSASSDIIWRGRIIFFLAFCSFVALLDILALFQ